MKFTKLGCFALEVVKFNLFKVFVSTNKKYLIISGLNKDFSNIRILFNIKSGKFLFMAIDRENNQDYQILLTDKCWIREIGNTQLVLTNKNKIVSFIQKIKLSPIKYPVHKKLINPFLNKNKSSTTNK